jgi:hypothetical protein
MAPRPPNYNQARGDRDRAKEQKKQERLRRREEDALRRKATRSEPTLPATPSDGAGSPTSTE